MKCPRQCAKQALTRKPHYKTTTIRPWHQHMTWNSRGSARSNPWNANPIRLVRRLLIAWNVIYNARAIRACSDHELTCPCPELTFPALVMESVWKRATCRAIPKFSPNAAPATKSDIPILLHHQKLHLPGKVTLQSFLVSLSSLLSPRFLSLLFSSLLFFSLLFFSLLFSSFLFSFFQVSSIS